jgi:hypothetical protein
VEKGLSMRVHCRDAIAQFLVHRSPWRHTTFLLDGREHLCRVNVSTPDVSVYQSLLSDGGAV